MDNQIMQDLVGKSKTKKVFEEVSVNRLKLKNRLVRSATWEGLGMPDGSLPEEVFEIYEELAKGGVGAIITGFTSVSADDFYFNGMMRLSSEDLIQQYKRLTDIIHKQNCPVIAQLALGAYYRVREGEAYRQIEPDGMTADEIGQVSGYSGRLRDVRRMPDMTVYRSMRRISSS